MIQQSLLNKYQTQFITCTAVLLLLATPLFYWLTKLYYAEDMIDVIESVKRGNPIPDIDLEEDIMQGLMIHFGLIAAIIGIAMFVTMTLIAKNTWRPFDSTLKKTENFSLEDGTMPQFNDSDVREFNRLNRSLEKLIGNSFETYRSQKEFTENASHELQTPLAILHSKLDILIQQTGLNEEQATIIQQLYETVSRMTRLNRNLLLLAKIDNKQYNNMVPTDVAAEIIRIKNNLDTLAEGITIRIHLNQSHLKVQANTVLFESMVNNLVVNAVRHNKAQGEIEITLSGDILTVSNTSDNNEPLDSRHIFNRFYRPMGREKGNGLGLAIVKAICDYHGWTVTYDFQKTRHIFAVKFHIGR